MKKIIVIYSLVFFHLVLFAQEQDSTRLTTEKDRISDFRDNMIDWTGHDLIDASFPNSWPIFGSKGRMSIGGFVKLDYLQDFNGVYDRHQVTIGNIQVPGDGRPEQSGYMNMFARESRFNIDFRSVTQDDIPFRIFFEVDFYNLDRLPFNQAPRLRHAYGVCGRLLIGRSWGTTTDLYAVPVTIDFGVGDAVTGTRRAQIRWEDQISDQVNYALALEMLEYSGIDFGKEEGQPSPNLPVLAARITKKTKKGGRLFLGGQLFQLRWDPDGPEKPTTAMGWGFNFSGREYFGSKKHFLYWIASYGSGYGSNILTLLGDGSATIRPDGTIDPMNVVNLGAGFNYNISSTLAINLNGYYARIDPSEFRDENKIESGYSTHLNMIWAPIKNVNTGIEYIYGQRTNVSEVSGSAHRVQLMFKYLFN